MKYNHTFHKRLKSTHLAYQLEMYIIILPLDHHLETGTILNLQLEIGITLDHHLETGTILEHPLEHAGPLWRTISLPGKLL